MIYHKQHTYIIILSVIVQQLQEYSYRLAIHRSTYLLSNLQKHLLKTHCNYYYNFSLVVHWTES